MKIYSMTATFGKLDHETLTLKPGLNVIQAPNEWGKSTWCAFLTAMLYGLDTRMHSTKTALSDKERYSPWSGAPMAGRIDLNWNGRDITIERKAKGRTVFGDFRAYETASGVTVPELTAQNCGQLLLGVEKTVFTRSAMIRQTDLPVTQDEALRRRLNALVTTGDDSGTGDDLERRLRELKNRCRYNRTGLLPQAEAEAAELDSKLRELEQLELQSRSLRQHCTVLEENISKLENHRIALAFRAAKENAAHRQNAESALLQAKQDLANLDKQCAQLPPEAQSQETLSQLRDVQNRWAQIRIETAISGGTPAHPLFHGMTPEEAMRKANSDAAQYARLRKLHIWIPLLAVLILLAGITALYLVPQYSLCGYAAIAAGVPVVLGWAIAVALRFSKAAKIAAPYGHTNPMEWISAAEVYVNLCGNIQRTEAQQQESIEALRQRTAQLCQGHPLAEALAFWQDACSLWARRNTARKEYELHLQRLAVLDTLPADAPTPTHPDDLTLSDPQTRQAITEAARELRQLQHRLGQCQGQMEAIGHRTDLENRRDTLSQRIHRLEETYSALEVALSTLENARAALQRRFAPRITTRAQEILNRLSGGRYDRLVLASDLTLHATTREESTLRSSLWRSDGTADLLYLALRLAVSGELTPEAPLILDDALVRFDDRRLERTMSVLKEEAEHRQILLFTCHCRESQYIDGHL